MQISLERRGDYSVRALIDLSTHYGRGRRKAREIARVMDIPVRYLPQLLAPLIREGLVTAVAGPDGGYQLTRSPAEVTLLEVIEIAEGPLESPRCVLRGGPCDWDEGCPVHDRWTSARHAFAAELADTTFAELAEVDEQLQENTVRRDTPLHPEPVERRGIRGQR